MSSRALKRLQGGPEKELENLRAAAEAAEKEESDEENEKNGTLLKAVHLNPFELLNQSFSESEVKEDDNETEHASTAANLCSNPAASKKKKRKRKKKTKHSASHISSEDNEITLFVCRAGSSASHQSKFSTPRIDVDKSLLTVELKHLNPYNEMRRTFGKRVVKIENKRGRQKLTLKSTHLVTPKDSWPPVTKNVITMKSTSPPESAPTVNIFEGGIKVQWFAFEHSEFYQSVQNIFLSALESSADSDFLINLIRRCPYHVDSLIQLSEFCKMTEDYALASELLERALFVLESALHPSFSLTSGNCCLDYRRQENRAFFIVLFKQAQYLEGRACCRTAFELSKLIMNLNADDPLAMVLVVDYYALRSKQYSWLIKYYEEYDAVRNLSQLPNMAYSYAFALFCVHGQCETADSALQYALLMFPGLLRPLLQELSVKTDSRVLASSYFNVDISLSQSPALNQLICLYLCRAKIVWKQSQMLPWLESNVNIVLDRIDKKDPVLEEYGQKRATRYGKPPRPILRHVALADYKEKVPLEIFLVNEKMSLMAYDPIPPVDSINFYQRKSSSSSPTTATPNHTLPMFFQSLLPNFNLENRRAGTEAADDGALNDLAQIDQHLEALNVNIANADGGANGGPRAIDGHVVYGDLTASLTGIVNNLREFFQNFNITEGGQGPTAAAADNDSSEEDTTDCT